MRPLGPGLLVVCAACVGQPDPSTDVGVDSAPEVVDTDRDTLIDTDPGETERPDESDDATDVPATDLPETDTADTAGATDPPVDESDAPHTDPVDTAHTDDPIDLGPPPNVLLVILDDVGVELIDTYGLQPSVAAPTPTIDRLADEGIVFERAYANPWCSATRATILTGQYSRRFGIGRSIEPWSEPTEIPEAVVTLPELLQAAPNGPYTSEGFGKWHLSSASGHGADGPLVAGFQHFRGTFGNLAAGHTLDRQGANYFGWERIEDGATSRVSGYVTTTTIDDTIDFVTTAPEPWLAWVAVHAAHTPWHVPPQDLHTLGTPTGAVAQTRAMLEAADTELGRLLDTIDPAVLARTTIVVIGDNGTTGSALAGLYAGQPSKSTVYEPGIHVPLIVAGASVAAPGSRTDALVQSADLYPTISALAGIDLAPGTVDGRSFARLLRDPTAPGARDFVYLEAFSPDVDPDSDYRTVRDDRWKLMRLRTKMRTNPTAAPVEHFYDVGHEPLDGPDLLPGPMTSQAKAAYDRLSALLDAQFPP